jgi:hypothetical protein
MFFQRKRTLAVVCSLVVFSLAMGAYLYFQNRQAPGAVCECDNIYQPVCDDTGITHPNSCVAKCVQAVVRSNSACENSDYQWGE